MFLVFFNMMPVGDSSTFHFPLSDLSELTLYWSEQTEDPAVGQWCPEVQSTPPLLKQSSVSQRFSSVRVCNLLTSLSTLLLISNLF